MTVWPGLLILFIYLLWYCREQPLTRSLELSTDGIALPETEDQDAALALLPAIFLTRKDDELARIYIDVVATEVGRDK